MARTFRSVDNGKSNVQASSSVSVNMQEEDSIDLLGLMYRYIENLKYIVALALLGAVAMGVFTTYFITPLYKTTAKIYVLSADDAAINLADFQIGTYLTADYQEVFSNWIVHERVIEALGLPYSYGKLASMLSVTNPSNTRILYITVTSPDPKEAKAIADTYAKVAQEFIATTMDTKEPNLFEEARLPTGPFSPNRTKNIGLGFLAGFLLSIIIITIRFITGDKIRTTDDIERHVGLPTLGVISTQMHKFPVDTDTANKNKSKKTRSKKGGASA